MGLGQSILLIFLVSFSTFRFYTGMLSEEKQARAQAFATSLFTAFLFFMGLTHVIAS